MRKWFLLLIVLMFSFTASAQTVVFHENFESPSGADSVTPSGTTYPWSVNARIYAQGVRCDSNYVQAGDTSFLTTASFNCTGYPNVILQFKHICKIELTDAGEVEISVDGGLTWTKLTGTHYLNPGNSQFVSMGNKFNCITYVSPDVWSYNNATAKPQPSWFMPEQFDISAIAANQPDVRIRFILRDGTSNGANFNHGWYIDDLTVLGSAGELIPPKITMKAPIIKDTVGYTGPFQVMATITDISGVDTAYIEYSVNAGPAMFVPMTWVSDSTFSGLIPSYTYGNRVDYKVHAIDSSATQNAAEGTSYWFFIKRPPMAIIIGEGTSTQSYLPLSAYYNYSWGNQLYLASEISHVGIIDSIGFYVGSVTAPFPVLNQKVWVGLTSATTLGTAQPDTSLMTLVYNGTVTYNGVGWASFKPSVNITIDGTANLMIYWVNKDGDYESGYPNFAYTPTGTYQAAYSRSDTYSTVFPTSTGTLTYNRPNLKLLFPTIYVPGTEDAGVEEILAPEATSQANVNMPLEITIKNYGTDTLRKATIQWTLDGVPQTDYVWTGLLPEDVVSSVFTVGTFNVPMGSHDIKVWTSLPNDSTDIANYNDTLSVAFYACDSLLNGTYTIGATGDFTNFDDVMTALYMCGIQGPVVFNIQNGVYTEQLDFAEIIGASAINTVTFQSESGNNDDVILQYTATGTADNFVINLNGADHMRFRNLTLKNTGSGYGRIITVGNVATNNIIEGNHLIAAATSSSSVNTALIYSGGTQDSLTTIRNNSIENGSYGIYWYGSSSSARETKTTIINNTLRDQYAYGIRVAYQDAVVLSGNTITSNASGVYGIYLYYSYNANQIVKNTINLTGGGYGIDVYYSDGVSGGEILVANNMISVGGATTSYGIYDSYSTNVKVYYNSVNVYTNYTTARALYLAGSSTADFFHYYQNNILAYTGPHTSGMAAYISTTALVTYMDYNDLYSTGTNLGYWSANRATLAAWRTASLKDSNSVSLNPQFITPLNLHTFSPNIVDKGKPVVDVLDDIDGEIRSLTVPDIGADEFALSTYNVGVDSVAAPQNGCSHTSTQAVAVRVRNMGLAAASNIDVYYVLNGGTPVHEVIPGPLASGTTMVYTFTTTADVSAYGNYTLDFYVHLTGDTLTSNDTLSGYTFYSGYDFSGGAYTQGFEPTEYYADWKAFSVGADTYTYEFPYSSSTYAHSGSYSARYYTASSNTTGDWLFSRCFPLEAGKTYKISFWYRASSATYPQGVTLKYGMGATPAAMTNTLATITGFTSTTYAQSVTQFVAPATGSYNFGWYSNTANSGYHYIDDINISVVPEQEAALEKIHRPEGGCGLTSAEDVIIHVKNTGALPIVGNLTANYKVNGGATVSEVIPATLAPLDTLDYVFTAKLNLAVTQDSTFDITAWINLPGDPFTTNDSAFKSVDSYHVPLDPMIVNDTVIFGTQATLHAYAADSVYWYTSPVETAHFFMGQTYVTPQLFDTVTYYVAAKAESGTANVGAPNTAIGAGGSGTTSWEMIFDVLNPSGVTIKSVDMYPTTTAGSAFTVIVENASGTQVASYSGVTTVPSGSMETVPINLTIPFGTGYNMYMSPNPGFYRNTAGSAYPYTIPGEISITGNGFGPEYYYWFYNWQIAGSGCESNRLPVTAFVVIPPEDLAVLDLLSPVDGCTFGTEPVSVTLTNNGYNTITNSYSLGYFIDGNPIPTVEVVTTDIAPGDTITYTFTTPAVVPVASGEATFNIMVYGENTNDIYFIDDTINGAFTLRYSPEDPIAIHDTVLYGTSATLEAQSPYTINWFTQPSGGSAVQTGQYYNTPVLYGDETMYVQATNAVPGGVTIIGTGTSTESYVPAYGYYDYGWSSTLFTPAELGFTGRIDSIGYYVGTLSSPYTLYSQSIYMGVVPYATFTDLYPTNTTTFTQVYSGDLTFPGPGWFKIALQTPFVYDGTGSLEIAWTNNDGDYASGYPNFRYTTTTGTMAKYDYQDGSMPTVEGSASTSRPNMYFSHETQGCPSHSVPVYAVVTGQPDLDAGVVEILQPVSPTSLGVKNIEVVIRNFGLDTLETAEINWTMNGVLQTPFVWNGSLLTGQIDTTTIGTYDFTYQPYPGNNALVVWSELPNGQPDPMALNDSSSLQIDAHDPYNGTYYLGTATPDFPDFTFAAAALKDWGVSGPVIILVEAGTYVEQVVFDSIPGTSAVNTITFRSLSGENTDVVVSYGGATSAANYVVKLNNGNYMHFEDMTFKSTTTGSYGRVIELAGGSSYNHFEGNIIQGVVSTSTTTAVVYSGAGSDNFNRFIGNQILNGYYGVYFYGASANRKQGNQFIDNVVKGWYYYGIYTYYSDSVRIIGNQVEHGTNASTTYSIYLAYANNGARVERNKVKVTSSGSTYGLYAYYNNQSTTVPTLIANNFISASGGTGTVYGLYLYYSNYLDVVFNSVNINGGSASGGRALYTYSSSNTHHNYLNNNLANTASGYAYYVSAASVVDASDFNNLYTNGSVLAYFAADAATLADLQATSGKDLTSVCSSPAFVGTHDLHTFNIDLYNTGMAYAGVTTDIDLDPRHALTPCIGADEFLPPSVDAGIVSINTPVSPVGSGPQTIKVSLRNFGLDPLTNVTIAWSVDGILGTSFAWTGSLTAGAVLDSIAIGSYTFSSGASEIMAWTSLPNATTDPNAANDTAYKTVVACSGPLAGTYTIGPVAANFVDFSEAVLALQYCGVSAPVVFNVQSGIYNEHIVIRPVDGASATNTITFQSATGVNTDVTLRYAASTASDNYVLWLDSANHIRFRNLTLQASSANSYGYVVVINGGASYNNFENNILQSVPSTSSTTAPVYSGSGASDSYNVFVNNQMKDGYYGVYYYGSSSVRKYSNKFIGNTITGAYYYGLYTYYNDSLQVTGNRIRNATNSSSFYGMYLYYANNDLMVDKNIVTGTNTGTFYGIYLNYSDGTTAYPNVVRNNFVSQSVGAGTAYGIYSYYSDFVNIVNNSVNINGGSASAGRAFYLSNGSEVKLLNNNFVNSGPGYAYYINSTAAVVASNFNNYYSATTTFAYWGLAVANLAALQTANSMDSNSVSQDPVFLSASDLHVVSPGVNNVGTPLPYVTEDIDGQPRSATTPDIGADEFTPLPKDLAATAFVLPTAAFAPVGNSMNVTLKVRNLGADTLTSFTLYYKYATAPLVTEAWTGVLAPSATVDHAFVVPFTALSGLNNLTAYVVLSGDGNIHNDTIVKTFTGVPVLVVPDSTDFENGTSFYADGPAGLWEFGVPTAATINAAHSPVNCWKTNLDGVYGDSQNEYLYTPYYSFTQVTGATLKFWHWYETEVGYDGGKIEYNITGTSTWITLGYIADPAATNWYSAIISGTPAFEGSSAGWVQSTYDLAAIPAIVNATVPVQFRFKFFTDPSGVYDGWAIDDFTISAPPLAKDAGVIAITDPVGSSITGSNVTLSVQIYNYGADSLQSVPVAYRVNNGAVTQATWSGVLMPGDTADFTFPTTYVSPASTYEVCAFTKRAGDTYKFNDTTCVNINAMSAPFDAGVTALLSPTNTTIAGDSIPVIVRIRNFGSSALTSIPVGFSRNGVQLYSTTWTGNLAAGDSIEYTFPKKYVSPMAFYSLCAYSMLPGDAYTGNDQKCVYPEGVIGVEEYGAGGFMLWQNVPNPTTGLTSIAYQVPEGGNVVFELRDLYGRLLMSDQQQVSAGQYSFEIDAAPLSTGVYYYSIIFNDKQLTKKMMVH